MKRTRFAPGRASGSNCRRLACEQRGPGDGRPRSETSRLGGAATGQPYPAEAGYILIAVVFMVALVVLSLAIAAPKVAAAIQRDRELELVHRGEQYKRAIRLYYKKYGSYPTSIDQLVNTNNIRFLRKRYLDPLTGKDDWKLIHVGEAHVCPLGFFGQPLGTGAPIAGATSAASLASQSNAFGSSSGTNGGSFGGSSLGSGGSSFGSSASSSFGSSSVTGAGDTASSGSSGAGCATGGAANLNGPGSSGPIAGTGTTGDSGGSSGNFSGSAGGGAFGASTSTSTTLGGGNTNNGGFGASTSTTLGGGPIMGVEPPMTKATIVAYKLKSKYNEWEFAYWPAEDQQAAGSVLGGGGSNINGTTNSVNGPGSTGPNSGGSNFGLNSGQGSNSGNGFTSSPNSGFGGTGGGISGTPSQPSTPPQ